MRSFLNLSKISKNADITFRDVCISDLSRLLLSLAIMMPLAYGIGWLISTADPRQGPIDYYIQVLFANSPLVELIMVAAACAIAVGRKPPERFWSTAGVAAFISLLDLPTPLWYLDISGYLSIFAGILLMICGWRLWDYYKVRKLYAMSEPKLTKPALTTYIALGVLALILLLPF